MFKYSLPSFNSSLVRLVQDYPIKSCTALSDIRQANRGAVTLENTHPFTRLPANRGT
ncbi:MAG: class II glutamine amidotransferase [Candidatus Malihini olakiniferum]